jgi:Mrp family chromosome partitioning ATPase
MTTMSFPQTNLRVTQPRGAVVPLVGKETVVVPSQHTAKGPTTDVQLMEHRLELPKRPDRRLAMHLDPDSPRAAAFRVTRHHLLENGKPQVIVVSSPNRGEGKTTAAVNLALALAECGRAKVLLVEAHLRRPQLAQMFGFVPPMCLTQQLQDHRLNALAPWTFVDIPELWLNVAALDPRTERTQLLDGPAYAIAIERLRMAGYDHIVIDAPSVLGSAEVNLLADPADAVVLALRAKYSTLRDVRASIEQIGQAKIAGTVLIEK